MKYGANKLINVGRDFMLDKCVKGDVFPNMKFPNVDHHLAFSNDPNLICRFMAAKMEVREENVESWWNGVKKAVHTKLKCHRNNVIKAINTRFHGKFMGHTLKLYTPLF